MKPIPAIILAPLIAHPLWAVFMLTASVPIHTIGIDATYQVMPTDLAAAMMMFVASGAAWCSHFDRFHGTKLGFMLIVPQQFIMLLSIMTIITAVATEQYANNYSPIEGWRFIAADQILFFVCSVLHTRQVWLTYIDRHL